ncbi:MAG: prepilin-type N-terminal cleavage/methylation domain-containing protein [Burkholderiales bacterium]
MRADRDRRRPRADGFSLIETIVFIVIVSVALVGVLSVLNLTAARSADPMLIKQSVAIGEGFIDEILSRDYSNSTGVHTDPRSQFLGVDDYNTYSSTGITTRTGSAITGLAQYKVLVSVAAEAVINAAPMKAITVTVTDPSGNTYPFSAYKANY